MHWSSQLYALAASLLAILLLYHSCTPRSSDTMSLYSRQSKAEVAHNTSPTCHADGHQSPCCPFFDPQRDQWQKPQLLLDRFGPYEGKVIADIGAGYGYFALRLAQRGAHVIAIDIDSSILDSLLSLWHALNAQRGHLTTRLTSPTDPALTTHEVDQIWIVNTYHHFPNRIAYMKKVHKALKPDGQLILIDFKIDTLPVGPPPSIKIPYPQVIDELRQAGFTLLNVDLQTLPYQYIITAR